MFLDGHSPRVPELPHALRVIVMVLSEDQVWVNPDCGLKTRKPEEVWPALENMVVAKEVRAAVLEASPAD